MAARPASTLLLAVSSSLVAPVASREMISSCGNGGSLVNTASGATWVSVHHGGGVGIGNSIHAGMVVVADGTPLGQEKLRRVLTTDPGTGVMRHADAGYPDAIEFARRNGIDLPST